MTPEFLAKGLARAPYGWRPSIGEPESWKAAGLFVIWGDSDDLVEIRGVEDEELGAYGGREFWIHPGGLLMAEEDVNADNAKEYVKARRASVRLEAVWCDGEDAPCWTIKCPVPHATFDIIEDGKVYSRGIVVSVEDLGDPAVTAKPGQIISSTDMTAEDILKRVLRGLPRVINFDKAGFRWSSVGVATSLGSTSATELCRWAGLDPHEDVGPTEWEHLEDFVGADCMSDAVWERCGNGDPWPADAPKYRRDPQRNEED